MCKYVYLHMYICIYAKMFTCILLYIHVNIYVYTWVCIYLFRKPAESLGWRVCKRRSYGEANLGGLGGGLPKCTLFEGGGQN